MPRVSQSAAPAPAPKSRSAKAPAPAAENTADRPQAATLSLPQAAAYLGISERMAYKLVRGAKFPVPVLRIGSLIKVSRARLEEYVAREAT